MTHAALGAHDRLQIRSARFDSGSRLHPMPCGCGTHRALPAAFAQPRRLTRARAACATATVGSGPCPGHRTPARSQTSCRAPCSTGFRAGRRTGRAGRLRSAHPPDGSTRLLVELADGERVESVVLPSRWPVRLDAGRLCRRLRLLTGPDATGWCVNWEAPRSSRRSLSRARAADAQGSCSWAWARPAHNPTTWRRRSNCSGRSGGIGHKQLVFSTVGDLVRVFEAAAAARGQSLRWPCRCTRPGPICAALLPRAPGLEAGRTRRARRVHTRARPAIRSSSSGR